MKFIHLLLITFFATILFTSNSCKKQDDDTPITEECPSETPTYNGQIKDIINNNCALAGCHGDGTSPGIFTSYDGMKMWIDGGLIKQKAIDEKSMPPSPATLSSANYNLLRCWLEGGAPED